MSGEFRAGMLVVAAVGALVFMTTRLTQNQFAMKGTKVYYVNVTDATGLLWKSKVKMAGLDIGQLMKMELVGRRAKISVEIASDLEIHKDASIAVKAIGFLGDKYLELTPGSDAAPVLEEGGFINEGVASGSIDQLTQKTTQLVENLKEISEVLKNSLQGTGTDGDGTRLDRILDNMEQFSQGLAGMDKLGDLADKLTEIAANVNEVTGKVSRGEGTVGKLLSDSETIDRLNQALSGINKFVTKADKMQVFIDARSGMLTNIGGSRTQFSLMLQPTFDKYYLIGLTSRPQGTTKVTTKATTPNSDKAGATTTVEETKENSPGGVGLNLQFAKRFSDLTVRFGLFETTGGLGLDYHFLEDRVAATVELYRFGTGSKPQLNLGSEFKVYKPFFVWTGGDHLLNRDYRSFFIGGGIRFNDQDIKTLFTAAASAAPR